MAYPKGRQSEATSHGVELVDGREKERDLCEEYFESEAAVEILRRIREEIWA